jgi:predicted MPP superfamily phosphohydrolase
LWEQTHGLFPEKTGHPRYVRGRYDVSGTSLIVSRGLSNKDLLRINNKPELVIVDIGR